jgi:hypothetical protein
VTSFRVTGHDGRSADGPTPDDALTALQNLVTPVAPPAPLFPAWLVPRHGDRLVQRAWVVDRADKRGSVLLYPRDPESPSPDTDTGSIPRLWGGEHVYLQPGLAPGERCAPHLVSGESLALYRTTDAPPRTSVWADLFHADDPRMPALRTAIARNLFRRATARHLPTAQLALPAWRPFPTMQEVALHAARSGGAGVWAFRERTAKGRKLDAVLFTYAVAANSTPEAPRVVNERGAARLPLRTESPYAFHTATRGDWRPVSRRTLGPLPWPEAPLAPGDTVLTFAPTVADRGGKVMTVVALNTDARTVLLQTISSRPDWTRQLSYPLSRVKLLARAAIPALTP